MIPSSLVGLILLVAAIAPGYFYVRIAERRQVRPVRSAFLEAAELVVIGTVATTLAVGVAALCNELRPGVLLDLGAWASQGAPYLRSHPFPALWTAWFILGLSSIGAGGVAALIHGGRENSLVPGGSVWRDVFQPGGANCAIFVSVHLEDRSVVEGYLLSYPVGLTDRLDIALQAPIYVIDPAGQRHQVPNVERTILCQEEVVRLGVRYEPVGLGGAGPLGQ